MIQRQELETMHAVKCELQAHVSYLHGRPDTLFRRRGRAAYKWAIHVLSRPGLRLCDAPPFPEETPGLLGPVDEARMIFRERLEYLNSRLDTWDQSHPPPVRMFRQRDVALWVFQLLIEDPSLTVEEFISKYPLRLPE